MRWLPLRITDTKFNLTVFGLKAYSLLLKAYSLLLKAYRLKHPLPVALTVVL